MSWGTFAHNIARLKYSCSSLEDTYGGDWTTFQSDTGAFPDPTPFVISPSVFTGGVFDNPVMPVGQLPPVDTCSPDSLRRYVRVLDRVNLTPMVIGKGSAGDDGFVALIGPKDLTRVGTNYDASIRFANRFTFYYQNPNLSWSSCHVNVFVYTVDTNSDGTLDALRVEVVYNGSGSYWIVKPDAKNWDNSITAAEYAALWPSFPFSGTQPVDQGTSPSTFVDFSMDELFPDSNYLWTPLLIEVESTAPFAVSLTGNPYYSNRDSYWFHPSVTVKVGNLESVIEMPGDMMLSNNGTAISTDPWPTTPPTGLSSNVYFWGDAMTVQGVALGGLGTNISDFEEFRKIVALNRQEV